MNQSHFANEEKRIRILRKATMTVKVVPFAYSALLLALCPFEIWLSLEWSLVLALLVFTSLPSALLMMHMSKIFELCFWYRIQCLVMLLPVAIPLARIFHICIDPIWIWVVVSVLMIASLVNCYIVIIKPATRPTRKNKIRVKAK